MIFRLDNVAHSPPLRIALGAALPSDGDPKLQGLQAVGVGGAGRDGRRRVLGRSKSQGKHRRCL